MTSVDSAEASTELAAKFAALQQRLPRLYQVIHSNHPRKHRSVIVPSLTFDQDELAKVAGVSFYEERLLFFLLRLRDPRARVLYITSLPVDPDIVQYYLHLMVGMPASHAQRRLTMLCVHDASPRPLTQKVLERPRVMQRIRDWVGDRRSGYLTCFNSTLLEQELAVHLGIPLNAVDPALAALGTKSGSRRSFREAGVELPAGREGVRTEDDVVEALAALREERPRARRAVVKLDAGFAGEGNAVFTFPQEPPRDPAELRNTLRAQLPLMRFADDAEAPARFLAKLAEMGGIVEEFVEATEVHSPSVQMRITPTGDLRCVSTHDQVLGGPSGQVYLGCRFPANDEYRALILDRARRIGDLLRERGVLGRFAVDFLVYRSADQPRWQCVAIEINLRMTGTTFPLVALEFLTGGTLDADSGEFMSPRGVCKYYFATDTLASPAYRGLLPEDFMEIMVKHGLHFRPADESGVVFHMIGALSQFGKIGVTCIANQPAEADALYNRTRQVLDTEAGAPPNVIGRMSPLFDDWPRGMD